MFMKCAAEMGSGATIRTHSFIKIVFSIQNFCRGKVTYREADNREIEQA
jgi:hypothetical protein